MAGSWEVYRQQEGPATARYNGPWEVSDMPDLWGLVWGKPAIDPGELAAAIECEAGRDDLDFRTRLLIRDGAQALEDFWGRERYQGWLRQGRTGGRVEAISRAVLGPVKFPSIRERLVERTQPDTIRQFLRDLGTRLHHPVQMVIGGSVAIMLQADLARATEDIDVVDELPDEVRSLHAQLADLRRLYGLQLTHFQSHFLPAGWSERLHTLGSFGRLNVSLVDMYDLFLSKLFSPRDKDLADLRLLLPQVDREVLLRRLRESCQAFLAEHRLRAHAERSWYVLTGEGLP